MCPGGQSHTLRKCWIFGENYWDPSKRSSWEDFRRDLTLVVNAAPKTGATGPASRRDIRGPMDDLLGTGDEHLSKSEIKAARKLIGTADTWWYPKVQGIDAFKSDGRVAAKSLLKKCASVGLNIVPSGECESFVRDASGHGPAWLRDVLANNLHEEAAQGSAGTFVRQIVAIENHASR